VSEQPPADGGQQYPPPPGPYGPGQVPAGVGNLYGGATGPRANFGQRLLASFVDGVLLSIPSFVLGAAVGNGGGLVAVYLLIFVGEIAYFGLLEGGATGQTIGKRAAGIRVIDTRTGGPIGFWRAVLRLVGRIPSAVVCYLGYFWMLWDSEKQCWHDKIANDYVVPVAAYPVQR
jgi:uncharacterized RDD family membrane protein YckC